MSNYNSMVIRNGLDYHGHPYLGSSHPGNMSVDTQDALAPQNFSSHGNRPASQSQDSSSFSSQSDYLLQAQQSYSQSGGRLGFFPHFTPHSIKACLGDRDANQNNSDKLLVTDIEARARPAINSHKSSSISPQGKCEDSPTQSRVSSHFTTVPEVVIEKQTDIAANLSPTSNTSLSDSEVPDKENQNNPEQIDRQEEKGQGIDPSPNKDKEAELQSNRCSQEDQGNCGNKDQGLSPRVKQEPGEEERLRGSTSAVQSGEEKRTGSKFEVEETVKEHLEEAIRQHHHRVTQPTTTRLSPTSPPVTPSNNTSPRDASKHLASPSNNKTSPKSAAAAGIVSQGLPPHVRHLNFNPSPLHHHLSNHHSNNKLRDFPPDFSPFLGAPLPPQLAAAAAGLAFPQQPPLPPSALFPDFIPRSRSNTVPSTDPPRSRSSSFSSLPEHHLAGNGGRMRGTGDNKDLYYCHLCSFVGTTEAQFGSHMDSHFEHQCPHCDYKSRTEGRLKRHIKDFHSEENPEDFTGGRIVRKEAGKPKFFRCRQCDYVAEEKEDYWKHARSHIKDDKCLQCPKCPFVTEYKHHLEYHLRNHFGSKPFKCNKCNYSCVNKSMLNSHMKSHTNVYQYRCQDCTYATKYCHSLKLHLSKYNHQPATVLNMDGSLPVDGSGDFDLVSKRGPPRGPRLTKMPNAGPGFDGQMDPSLLGMQPGNMGASPNPLNGMAAMMGALWPNGLAGPPPLIPVSGLAPLNIQLPLERSSSNGHSPTEGSHSGSDSNGGSAGMMIPGKCHFCDFVSQSPQEVADHVTEEHGDKQDMLRMLREREEAEMMGYHMQMRTPPQHNGHKDGHLPATAATAAAAAAMHNGDTDLDVMRAKYGLQYQRSSSNEESPSHHHYGNNSHLTSTPDKDNNGMRAYYAHSHSSSPSKSPLSDSSPSTGEARYIRNSMAGEDVDREEFMGRQRKRQLPLDLTSKLSGDEDLSPSGSATKRRWEEGSYDEQSEDISQSLASNQYEDGEMVMSSQQRKRSRKGKAYKLDMISIKLQEQYGDHEAIEGGQEEVDEEDVDEEAEQLASRSGAEETIAATDIKTEPLDSDRESDPLDTDLSNTEFGGMHPSQSSKTSSDRLDSASVFSGSTDRRRLYVQQKSPYKKNSNTSLGQESFLKNQQEVENLPSPQKQAMQDDERQAGDNLHKYECTHCGIAFRDCIMYTMHMGYHGFQDPFTCNRCGETSKDKIEFFLHIARQAHA